MASHVIEDHNAHLVIAGGKGLAMFEGAEVIKEWTPKDMSTPYGDPSGKISLVKWAEGRFFCFSRHGDQQQLPPADIPYLANAYALKRLGVKYWVAVSLSTQLSGNPGFGGVAVADDYYFPNSPRDDLFFSPSTTPGLVYYPDNSTDNVSVSLKKALKKAADKAGIAISVNVERDFRDIEAEKRIVFAGVNGPETGTAAEEMVLKSLFSNTISGMTNMTEAKVCCQANIAFAGLNFIGGKGLNYGGVKEALQAYLEPQRGGVDAKITPILRELVKLDLPSVDLREVEEFLTSGTCSAEIKQDIESQDSLSDIGQRCRILIP